MSKIVYLDNSATTVVCEEAAKKAYYIMTEKYGNPSSLHTLGFEAAKELEAARDVIAGFLSVSPTEIFFTSGGTESNNTAVFGAVNALKRRGNRIVTTAIEHSSVVEAAEKLKKDGYEVIFLEPDESGVIPKEKFINAINSDTILVSVMAVNNETGIIQPIKLVSNIISKSGSPALFHCDAVQAFGKVNLKPQKLGVDLMSISSHKIHGPKGVGALYIRKGARIVPLHYGGEQERKIRPGTESLPLICAFAEAVKALPNIDDQHEKIEELWNYCKEKVLEIPNVYINSPDGVLPYILNISAVGVRSETMLHYLAESGIYVSSGSACAKGRKSHVLTAMGLSPERIDSAIRISFSKFNTKDDIDIFAEKLAEGMKNLAKSR